MKKIIQETSNQLKVENLIVYVDNNSLSKPNIIELYATNMTGYIALSKSKAKLLVKTLNKYIEMLK